MNSKENISLKLPNTENIHELLDLMSAYQKSRVLFSFVELEIPEVLSNKKLTASQIAQKKKIHPLAMEKLLNACVSVGLLKKENGKYTNAELTEIFLVKDGVEGGKEQKATLRV